MAVLNSSFSDKIAIFCSLREKSSFFMSYFSSSNKIYCYFYYPLDYSVCSLILRVGSSGWRVLNLFS